MEDIKINNLENNLSKEERKELDRLKRQEFFIQRSKKKFGDQFDYSKVFYIDSKTPVILICNHHKKEFKVVPILHLYLENGACPDCLLTSTTLEKIKSIKCSINPLNTEEDLIEILREKFKKSLCNFDNLYYVNPFDEKGQKRVSFYCEEHGEVEENVWYLRSNHVTNCCPKCREESNFNSIKSDNYKNKFFKTVKEKFKDNLDLSNSVYVNYKTPVKFICKIHGEQEALPSSIMKSACGCPKCSAEKASREWNLTTEEFIRRALEIPGNAEKYDYSKTVYVNSKTKVEIFCKTCQEYFWQSPYGHLNGRGHDKCSKYYPKDSQEVLNKLNDLCGNKIDFSTSEYKSMGTPLEVKCKEKGHNFKRSPDVFFNGHTDCPYCTGKRINNKEYKESLENYFEGLYDFSEVEYIDRLTPIKIICYEHGDFYKTPAYIKSVIRKGGKILCPHCTESDGERITTEFLKNNNILYKIQYKFDGCRNINPLPFDFYLPDYNVCIEYQGEQHYSEKEYNRLCRNSNRNGGFLGLLKRDQIKKDYCKNNRISLLEIKHDIPLDQVNDRLQDIFDKIDFKNSPCHILITKDEEIVEPY